MLSCPKVYLVGAGPGDPGLFTLRGVEVLKRADVVIYDGLVNRELLKYAHPKAEIIYGGRFDRSHSLPQVELNALLLKKAGEGKCVVRLKGGDPYIFGRGGEEAECLADAGIPFEVVPGVTSIHSAAACAGIPLTHRGYNQSLTVVTGHEAPSSPDNKVDWARIAQSLGTLVIMMGLRNLAEIAATLIQNGKPANTPTAVVCRGSTARQITVAGTLSDIASKAAQTGLRSPVIIIVGDVVKLRDKLNWFESRPLFGQRIAITQRRDLADSAVNLFSELGADVLRVPATRWVEHHQTRDEIIEKAGTFDWILFSNPNAVEFFFKRYLAQKGDIRQLARVHLGAYGPQTGERLRAWGLKPVAVAADHKKPLIMAAVTAAGPVNGKRFLILRGDFATEAVPEALRELGATVEVAPGYAVEPETDDVTSDAARMLEEGVDWIVFASALAIEHFNHRFNLPELMQRFPSLRLAIASPDIQWALEKLNLVPTVVSRPNDNQFLADAISRAVQ